APCCPTRPCRTPMPAARARVRRGPRSFSSASSSSSTPLHEGARLHDVDLPLHVDPLDVLLLPAEDLTDERCRARKPTHNVVGQHRALARDGNLFDAAALVEGEEAVLF